MTSRKRRRPTPFFGIPPPFSPITGEYATLRVEGIYPYCAMMQVAVADTYADYVICRGFDPRILKFIDYEAGNADKPGISVAKPFGNRTIGAYTVAQVYPAFLPTQGPAGRGGLEGDYTPPSPTAVDWRVGQNPGKASTALSGGQPTNLSATITELIDHNSKYVQWMLIDRGSGGGETSWGVAKTNWTDNGASCDHVVIYPCDDCEGTNPDTGTEITVLLPKAAEQDPNVVTDDVIAYMEAEDATHVAVTDYLDEKIGTVKMWALASGSVQPGWAVMNGSDNAGPAGSAIDLTDKFVRGKATSGGSGGTADHTHTVDLTIYSHNVADLAFSLDHKHHVEIDPHSVLELRHEHPIATGTPFNQGAGTQRDKPALCTGWPVGAYAGSEGSCSGYDWGPLYHHGETEPAYLSGSIPEQELYHEYEITIDESPHLPEYIEMIFIERIDNSA